MQDLVQLPAAPRLPVLDDDDHPVGAFPVGRVFCVGRNYAAHAREMGADPDAEPPFFFMKPASAVTGSPAIAYPPATGELHHEVELVLAWGGAAVLGCGIGLDLTRRDRQGEMKAAGRPWEAGKVFPGAAPCGPLRRGTAVLDAPDAELRLDVNGVRRQTGRLGEMIHGVPELLRALDGLFALAPGDLIFTGTPAGVGPLQPGDAIVARLADLPPLELSILETD